jgi:type II secretory pathway pseudopilin PulG
MAMRRLYKQSKDGRDSGEQGFSIIGVVVGISVLAVMALVAMRFFEHRVAAQRHIRSQAAVQTMEEGVANEILNLIHQNLNSAVNGCLRVANVFNNIPLEGGSSMFYSRQIEFPGTHKPDYLTTAMRRCARPRLVQDRANSNDNKLRFCLQFNTSQNASLGSFLNSDAAFAEVYFEMVDLQTGDSMSCQEYVASRNHNRVGHNGGSAIVSLYWGHRQANGQMQYNKSRFLTFVNSQ